MNGYSLFEHALQNILRSVNPLEEDWSMRFQLIHELRAVVESIEILRGATVEPFGSFVSNLFTRWGDLDISIELPNGSYISSAGKKYKLSLLGDVLKALRAKGGCRKLQFITNARVPILKFQGNYNISCDISINNLSGQMKSKILYWINMIDGRFRDMVLLVKEWAKAHNVNDSKTGTLNSYSLSLLVVFHFQVRMSSSAHLYLLPSLSPLSFLPYHQWYGGGSNRFTSRDSCRLIVFPLAAVFPSYSLMFFYLQYFLRIPLCFSICRYGGGSNRFTSRDSCRLSCANSTLDVASMSDSPKKAGKYGPLNVSKAVTATYSLIDRIDSSFLELEDYASAFVEEFSSSLSSSDGSNGIFES
ncbi:hypothetical protein BC332_15129 [Capsicum chinense]|nr:hypothetical protein BC332_15129 [Capsicum chinense]